MKNKKIKELQKRVTLLEEDLATLEVYCSVIGTQYYDLKEQYATSCKIEPRKEDLDDAQNAPESSQEEQNTVAHKMVVESLEDVQQALDDVRASFDIYVRSVSLKR